MTWLVGKIPISSVDTTGDFTIDSDGTVTIHAAILALETDGGILSLTGDSTNDIDISNPGAAIDMDAATLAVNTTTSATIDSVGALTLGGASIGITADGGILALTGDGSADIDIYNAGANIDIDAATLAIDVTTSMALDSVGSVTLSGGSIGLTADGGILSLTGDGSADIDISNAAAGIDIDSATLTANATTSIALDSAGSFTLGGASIGLTADGGVLALTGDGSNDIDISNAGAAIDIDSTTLNVDTTGAMSLYAATTMSFIAAGGVVMQLSVALDNETAHGVTSEGTVTPATTFGQALLIDATGAYVLTDADAIATMPCRALAIDTGSGAAKSLLKQGFIRNDAWSWTPGKSLYVSATAGALTQTVPSVTGHYAQAVGYAETATIVYFNPSGYIHEIG